MRRLAIHVSLQVTPQPAEKPDERVRCQGADHEVGSERVKGDRERFDHSQHAELQTDRSFWGVAFEEARRMLSVEIKNNTREREVKMFGVSE
jgi:hypothetical protein